MLVFRFSFFSQYKRNAAVKKVSPSKKSLAPVVKCTSLDFGNMIEVNGSLTYEPRDTVLGYETTKKVIGEVLNWEKHRTDVPFKGKMQFNQGGLFALDEIFQECNQYTNFKQLSMSFKDVNIDSIKKSAEGLKRAYFLQSLHIDFTSLDPLPVSFALNIYINALYGVEGNLLNLEVLHLEGPADLASFLLGISLVADGKVKNLIFSGAKPEVLCAPEGITIIFDNNQTLIRKSIEKRTKKSVSFSNPTNILKDR